MTWIEFSHRSAREGVMTPALTDIGPAVSADVRADGLATLEQRGSVAETFGIPLAVLAELTHRLPPAVSLLFQSGRAGARRKRADDGGMEEGTERTCRAGRAANPFLRRRADRAQGSGRTRSARQRHRAVLQPDYFGRAADARKTIGAGRRRTFPRANQLPGQRAPCRRPGRRIQGRPSKETRGGEVDARA